MQSLKVSSSSAFTPVDIEPNKDKVLCEKIMKDQKLCGTIEKTGFVFYNLQLRGAQETVRELVNFLTYEGKRVGIRRHNQTNACIYNIGWTKKYADDLLFWQNRVSKAIKE